MNTITTSVQFKDIFIKWLRDKFYAYPLTNRDVDIIVESLYDINNTTRFLLIDFIIKSNREQLFLLKVDEFMTVNLIGVERYNPKYIKELTKLLTKTFQLIPLEICEKIENAEVIGEV